MGGMNRAFFPERIQPLAAILSYINRTNVKPSVPEKESDPERLDAPEKSKNHWRRKAEGYRMLNKRRAKRRRRNQLRRAQRQHTRRKRGRAA